MRSIYLSTLGVFFALTTTACAPTGGERRTTTTAQQQSPVSSLSPTPQASPTVGATTPTSSPSASTSNPIDSVKRITVAELRSALERNEAVVVDVRAAAQYSSKHIKGARHIAVGEIAARAKELPRNKTIVTYCS